jgi:hypothetical protein
LALFRNFRQHVSDPWMSVAKKRRIPLPCCGIETPAKPRI